MDEVDPRPPKLLAQTVDVELGLEGHGVTLDAGGATGIQKQKLVQKWEDMKGSQCNVLF